MDANTAASVVAAGAAVLAIGVGVITSRRATEAQKSAVDRTIKAQQLEAELARQNKHVDSLSDALTEWCVLSYTVHFHYLQAMESPTAPWPGEHNDLVEREGVLWTQMMLLIDKTRAEDRRLLEAMETLRKHMDRGPSIRMRSSRDFTPCEMRGGTKCRESDPYGCRLRGGPFRAGFLLLASQTIAIGVEVVRI
jgi:hypothetical protein